MMSVLWGVIRKNMQARSITIASRPKNGKTNNFGTSSGTFWEGFGGYLGVCLGGFWKGFVVFLKGV